MNLRDDTEWRQAYADAGFLVFPEMIQSEPEPTCGLARLWIIVVFSHLSFLCAGVGLGMTLARVG